MLSTESLNHQDKFIDHPYPSFLLVIATSLVLILSLLAIPFGIFLVGKIKLTGSIFVIGCAFLALFYSILTLLALGTTRYSLNQKGINIRFGIWRRYFPWAEVNNYYQHRDNFAFKVTSPGMTPCARLNNAIVLKMKSGKFIYLTPKDVSQMLVKLNEFLGKPAGSEPDHL
jgi:hypothetical protein